MPQGHNIASNHYKSLKCNSRQLRATHAMHVIQATNKQMRQSNKNEVKLARKYESICRQILYVILWRSAASDGAYRGFGQEGRYVGDQDARNFIYKNLRFLQDFSKYKIYFFLNFGVESSSHWDWMTKKKEISILFIESSICDMVGKNIVMLK